jgi:hypothetical protein
MTRIKFQLRWLMGAVATVAILLSLPAAASFLIMLVLLPAVLILVPAALAPPERRVEVAYWAMALHPLLFLAWLSAWRFLVNPGQIHPEDYAWPHSLIVVPYALLLLSRFYLPIMGGLGAVLSANRFSGRSLARPLLVLPVVWLTTLFVLGRDPFAILYWFWF